MKQLLLTVAIVMAGTAVTAAQDVRVEKKIEEQVGGLQGKVTDRLEGELGDLRQELDQAVNRVTAEALKRKAASLGQVKEMTEDPSPRSGA